MRGVGHECRLMKARENQFQLARIIIDITNSEDRRLRSLKSLGVDRNQVFFKVQAKFGNRAKLIVSP